MIFGIKLRKLAGTLLIYALLLAAASVIFQTRQESSVLEASAKGKQLYDLSYMAGSPLRQEPVEAAVSRDAQLSALLAASEVEFLNAVRLSRGESRQWQDAGCRQNNCAQVTYYDYTNGGTINAVINLDSNQTVGRWVDRQARPGGSTAILPKAMAIAGADPGVRAVLGDIGEPDPAMIPMSAWLTDDQCREDWCVDLTYMDPAKSGRVFHIFVNLQEERVARTFFTRSRPERSKSDPLSRRQAYDDGCHQQSGWEVCWEMTAHDGLNFRDASYQGQLIFSSVKITQIEAWYPSWPGGYRDEIGFAASVPPFGGTEIVDLGDGFQVSQLFTEFTYWPNCICCYRYEQIIRFYADGAMEFEFISHGPGCDDVPIYRPFWRIDLNLDGPQDDQAWVWQDNAWRELQEEIELFPFVDELSPEGHKLATFQEDLHYRWQMLSTDPLGRDESRVFVVSFKPEEGDGPLATGPGDTYQPPRQWVDGEPVSGSDFVLWFVPILKQLNGGPWWCMPDPEPDFSPCNAILRAEPAGELQQLTAEELAQLEQAEAAPTATPQPTPENQPTAAPTATPEPPQMLLGDDAQTLIRAAGCSACHLIGDIGEAHKVGPDLSYIGATAGERIPGVTAEAYLRQSIMDPNAFIAPDCPNGPCMPNIMPRDYPSRMSDEQISTIVAFLVSLDEIPVDISRIGENGAGQAAPPAPKAVAQPKMGARPADNVSDLSVQLLLLAIMFLLTLFRLINQARQQDN